jgi:nucleotide-binding universal stress UspA family protein
MFPEDEPPAMYDDILVPTDGSEGTRGAVERAVDFAKTYDAALHTIYVVDTTVGVDAGAVGPLEALEEAGREAIDEVIRQAEAADVERVEGSIARGTPHSAILEYVDENGVDLIVMGTHGRTGLDRYLLGSVTEKIVRMAEVPVVTVPMPADSSGEES